MHATRPLTEPSAQVPYVSVVMPVRNEARYIRRAIESVLAQSYPADRMEIIVADGMSGDATREIVRSFASSGVSIRVIDNPSLFVPAGLNAAIQQSAGQVIVRIDGHCEIEPDYIRNAVRHLTEGAECVGGPLETVSETAGARAIACAMSSSFGVGGSAFRTIKGKTMLTDTVPFPAFKREVLERAGRFDEEMVRNQDDEYSFRLRKLGLRVLLAADVRSRYYSRMSLRGLMSQNFQYGYWKVRVMQKHPRQMKLRHFIPPLFVAAVLGAGIAAPWLGVVPLAIVVGAYAAANLAASIVTAARNGWEILPKLPVAYAALHLSYGTGFLVGFIKFFDRWGK